MPRLFLHIGGPKTGTTSFQARLAQPGALDDTGFWTPKTGRVRSGAHHLLMRALIGFNETTLRSETAFDRLRREVAGQSGDAVISSEFCARLLRLHRPLFVQLLGRLGALFDEIVIVNVWRDVSRLLNSRYQQAVCTFSSNEDFMAYALADARRDDQQIRFLLRRMQAGIPVINIAYREDGDFDSTATVARAIGLDWQAAPPTDRLNQSRPLAQLVASRELMQTDLADHDRLPRHQCHLAAALIRETIARQGGDDARFQGLTADRLGTIRAVTAQSRARLARSAWRMEWAEAMAPPPLAPHQSYDLQDLPERSRELALLAQANVREALSVIRAAPSPNNRNARSFFEETALLGTLTRAARKTA